jgi:hypothetical protein
VVLQAAKDIEEQSAGGGPDDWKRSFVSAMNHLAQKSAKHGSHSAATAKADVAESVCLSVQSSCITAQTVGSQQRAEAAKQKRLEAESAREESEWDASTCISSVSRSRALGATDPEEILRENPDLKHVHSAKSVKALVDRKERCMAAAQMCA